MNINYEKVYLEFEKIVSLSENAGYLNDMSINSQILNTFPFNKKSAEQQIGKMGSKYGMDLNFIANLTGNGKTIIYSEIQKSDSQIWNDLSYINSQIPVIACLRYFSKEMFKKCFARPLVLMSPFLYSFFTFAFWKPHI